MGRTVTYKYAVRMHVAGSMFLTPASWHSKQAGRPSDANLAKYVRLFEESTQAGGVNAHLGPMTVLAADIRENVMGGAVVAAYTK